MLYQFLIRVPCKGNIQFGAAGTDWQVAFLSQDMQDPMKSRTPKF
jgi:hypothetical protein